jgi:hypothetical protein
MFPTDNPLRTPPRLRTMAVQDLKEAGGHQIKAGIRLLEFSRLVHWHNLEFHPVEEPTFESELACIDAKYGRVICWINFRAGAEFLAKGVCLLNDIDIRLKSKRIPEYPEKTEKQPAIRQWSIQFLKNKDIGMRCVPNFGTMSGGDFNRGLKKLCEKYHLQDERFLVLSSYKLLRETIRNRDAHAYIENERQRHFYLVPQLFVPCFNILVSLLPSDCRDTLG